MLLNGQYGQFDFDGAFHSSKISIEEILFRNNLQKDDIKKYYFSQFGWKNLQKICEEMEEEINKVENINNKTNALNLIKNIKRRKTNQIKMYPIM